MRRVPVAVLFLFSVFLPLSLTEAGQTTQPANLVYDEAQTVYLGNVARRQQGLPPLRWNSQLTEAARWFAWDSVENRPEPYCGHQDSTGGWPGDRARAFGYKGAAGAENAFCGYVTPQQAIDGWMNSPGHRANLLDPNSREIGLGYYRRESDGRSYVAQKFGVDAVYPPVVINNEAISTPDALVDLYIHDRSPGGGFHQMGPATQMMVSNDPCFAGTNWEPYTAERSWSLAEGSGWRTVYVKTRDAMNRTVTVSDVIYAGTDVPLGELGLAQASNTQTEVMLHELDGNGLPLVQFSLGWVADDTYDTFTLHWGAGERVEDADAWGGTAFRLRPAAMESYAWVWTTEFIKDVPLVAYFRLKVSDNSANTSVARISVSGGNTTYGPVTLRGTDFSEADRYQEFALPFVFHETGEDFSFLTFNFWQTGHTDVFVDAVSIFTAPEPVSSPFTWPVPGGNYRGQGIWVRYTNGSTEFSSISEANLHTSRLEVTPASLVFFVAATGEAPPPQSLIVHTHGCETPAWETSSSAAWLQLHREDDAVAVSVNHSGLGLGSYHGTVQIKFVDQPDVAPFIVPVQLVITEQVHALYLPALMRE